MSVPTIPEIHYEVAFNADPNQGVLPPWWTDVSTRVRWGWTAGHGRQYESDVNEAGTWVAELYNGDGALDPNNATSPYAPNVVPYRQARIRTVLGANLLVPDQASAGDWSPLAAGTAPSWLGVTALGAGPATIAAVGGAAYAGSRVWATTVPSGTPGADLFAVSVPQATVGGVYAFSAQLQAVTSGQNPACYLVINWLGANGQPVNYAFGSPSTLTGGSGTWTGISVTGTAPAGTVAALLRVVTSTTPSANSTIWADGLQLEARGYATRWQMPWQTGTNLLPQAIGTGLETISPITDVASNWFGPVGTSGGTVARATNLTAAPPGTTTAVAWTVPAGATSATAALWVENTGSNGPAADTVQVTAGLAYTASAYLLRTASADATVAVTLAVTWYTSAGTTISTSSGSPATLSTGSWIRATVTGTAPAGAAWGRAHLSITTPGTTTAQNTLYATCWQMEQAAAASTWADPGVTAMLSSTMVERWPEVWRQADGTLGTSPLEAVDAFAGLAQIGLQAPFVNELLVLGPSFLYQLNEPAGATQVADTTGKRRPAPVEQSPAGAGSLVFGTTITASSQPSGLFAGTTGPVATFNNHTIFGGAGVPQVAETFVSLHKTTVLPGPPAAGAWTRLIAVRCPAAVPGLAMQLWHAEKASYIGSTTHVEIGFDPVGNLSLEVEDNAGNFLAFTTASPYADGNWHLAAIGMDPGTGHGTIWIDGAVAATGTGLVGLGQCASDVLGCQVTFGMNWIANGYVGDLALATEFPFLMTNAQMTNLYNSWRSASTGESSGARYSRVLTWAGWTGPAAVDAGQTQSMGPATDLTGDSALDALNLIALTENGNSFVAKDGTLTFKARSAVYNSRTPVITFGEGLPTGNAGEWPVEIGSFDYDPAHLANNVQVTAYEGPIYQATNTTSRQKYFPRTYTRQINTTTSSEPQDAATYLLSQMATPRQRADIIRLHPSAQLGLFPLAAQLEIGQRIRLIKRPIGAPSTTQDLFIQKIDWTWGSDNDVYVELQASPADLTAYGVLAAMHTTLNVQANASSNTCIINALPDAAYNKLSQSLPSGYSLRFEPGTPRDETLTLAPGGIPSTILGYSTATLTFSSTFAFTHPANSVVCEVLPTGYTDPTTWDASAVIGATATTVLSGGTSGTNTVVVGPLPDAATNPLGSTWNTGDIIQLSPNNPAASETAVIQSVATTYPPYTSCQLTLTANLAHSHAAGDTVCDPLPASVTSPSQLTPTLRLAY